jgi:hypothetical protein
MAAMVVVVVVAGKEWKISSKIKFHKHGMK